MTKEYRNVAKCIKITQSELDEIRRLSDVLDASDTKVLMMGIKLLANKVKNYGGSEPYTDIPMEINLGA